MFTQAIIRLFAASTTIDSKHQSGYSIKEQQPIAVNQQS
jgi:hypothetical protein